MANTETTINAIMHPKPNETSIDIEKTINVLKIYLEEQGHKYKGQNEIINK